MRFGFAHVVTVIFGSVKNIGFSIPRQNRKQDAFLVTFGSVIYTVAFGI